MPPTFSERLRRALRDDLRNPPYRLVRYAAGHGPRVERDGIEMSVTVQGRLSPSIIGYLTWTDPVSRHLWARIPREALHDTWMRVRGVEGQFVPPVWHGMLQTAGGTGGLIHGNPVTEPGTGKVRHDEEAEEEHERRIAAVVAEARRQLDQVTVPSIEELDLALRMNVKAAPVHPRALALYYAVRGRADDAQAVVDLAVAHHEREARSRDLDEAQRLRRFALCLRDAPVLAGD